MLDRLSAATTQEFSAGVALARPESTVEDLLRSADQACYLAKQAGRGRAVVADPDVCRLRRPGRWLAEGHGADPPCTSRGSEFPEPTVLGATGPGPAPAGHPGGRHPVPAPDRRRRHRRPRSPERPPFRPAPSPTSGPAQFPALDPRLRWKNPSHPPGGDFGPCAVPNAQLRVHGIPDRSDSWDAISSFSLSYDGYAYWDDVSELATRSIRNWTRHHCLPATIDEVRGCLFYEQRRWHHFGEEPNGRGGYYLWALLDSLRSLVAARTTATAPPPVAEAAAPSAPDHRPARPPGRPSVRFSTTTPATWPGPPAIRPASS